MRADGAQTHTRYGSGFHVETNPRGIVTERTFNARDELVEVRTYDPASASREAVYRYTRNGTGALVRILDPDGASRELAYGGVGRLHQATDQRSSSTAARLRANSTRSTTRARMTTSKGSRSTCGPTAPRRTCATVPMAGFETSNVGRI